MRTDTGTGAGGTDAGPGGQARDPVQASRLILETVVEHIPAAVNLIRGSDLRIILVNPAYRAIAPGKDMVGKTLDELWAETGGDFTTLCRRVLETGEPYHEDDAPYTIRRSPDGPLEKAYFSWSLHRVSLPGEEGHGILNTAWETTERRRAEEKIRHLASFPNLNPNPVLELDLAGKVVYANSYAERIAREAGLDSPSFLLPADMAGVLAELRLHPGSTATREVELGGRTFLISIFQPARLEVYRVYGVEITAARRAEEAHDALRHDLERAQEVGQIGSWRLDTRQNVLTWSDENHRIFGVPRGTPLSYETFLGIVHPDDRLYVDRMWKAGMRGEPYDIEHRLVVGGNVKWVREKAYLEFDREGALLGGFGITQDITERKRAEQALSESEERFSAIFRLSPVSLSLATFPEGRITDVNRTWLDMFGYDDKSEVLGKTSVELGLLPDFPERERIIEGFRREGSARNVEAVIRTRSGESRTVVAAIDSIEIHGRRFMISAIEDVTERRRAELALRKARERNAQQEKLAAIGRLAGGVAHELRNPLAAMKNAAYYLGMVADRSDPSVAETLSVLNREIARSDTIITSMLGLARTGPRPRSEVDISALLEGTLSAFTVPPGVSVEKRLDDALPPVAADPGQLSIIFGNLLRNACEAMIGGGRLGVSSTLDGRWVTVNVEDSGPGMPKEVLDRVFEPLFTTKPGGTGLGLPVAKMLVESADGTIEAQSEPGKGATFTVRLPVVPGGPR